MVLKRARSRWFGHVVRRDEGRIVKQALNFVVEGSRPVSIISRPTPYYCKTMMMMVVVVVVVVVVMVVMMMMMMTMMVTTMMSSYFYNTAHSFMLTCFSVIFVFCLILIFLANSGFYFSDENEHKQLLELEKEQESLNASLMALTSHFAQVNVIV